MASRGGGGGGGSIKGFYRQKKSGGITKSKSKPSPSKKTATLASSDQPHPAALISHGSLDLKDDYEERENVLKQFDMNMAYGPCIGMPRLARWERANKLGLNPPKDVENFLKQSKVGLECLWDGRV